jgi:hypothetical protein
VFDFTPSPVPPPFHTRLHHQITAITPLLKQTWSAGFLAAAFTCDALKTAADRHHLGLLGNRQLNLALMLLEGAFAAVLLLGMTVTGEGRAGCMGGPWSVTGV